MADFGKILMGVGILLVVLGALAILVGRLGLPLGRLSGDIVYRGKNTTFYFPIVTSIVVSVCLSLIFYLLRRMGK